jgi:predicted O-methyltransferase YrrM
MNTSLALVQIRPSSSTRKPSKKPAVQVAKTAPPESFTSSVRSSNVTNSCSATQSNPNPLGSKISGMVDQPLNSIRPEARETWSAVDSYVDAVLVGQDPILLEALAASEAAGLPGINVTAAQGKFLYLLARLRDARRILEIGTLGGYSTIWLARALPPGGRLITIEADPAHAAVARGNVTKAGLAEVVDLRVGRGVDVLPQIEMEDAGPFDFTFIDADKPSTPAYFTWALRLSRPGSIIVVDNVVRNGALADPGSQDASVQAMQRFTALLASEPRVSATIVQTVGAKGYDGFALALVTS